MDKSIDEEPKSQIAKKVVTATRKYFLPSAGKEVEADSVEVAIEQNDKDVTADDSER